jgi:hypothetical protein
MKSASTATEIEDEPCDRRKIGLALQAMGPNLRAVQSVQEAARGHPIRLLSSVLFLLALLDPSRTADLSFHGLN